MSWLGVGKPTPQWSVLMKYVRPVLYPVRAGLTADGACANGDAASPQRACASGPAAAGKGGCQAGAAADLNCRNGAAAEARCHAGAGHGGEEGRRGSMEAH